MWRLSGRQKGSARDVLFFFGREGEAHGDYQVFPSHPKKNPCAARTI
jgi:hypothetical protein